MIDLEKLTKKAHECMGWIIENIKLSDNVSANELCEIVKSAYLSGYYQKQKEVDIENSIGALKDLK